MLEQLLQYPVVCILKLDELDVGVDVQLLRRCFSELGAQLDRGAAGRAAGDKVPDELLDSYRLPQLVRGWEDGILRFLASGASGVPLPVSLPLQQRKGSLAAPAGSAV